MKTNFQKICATLAAVQCFNAGQTVEQIAKSAKVSQSQILGWFRAGGFRRVGNKYIVG